MITPPTPHVVISGDTLYGIAKHAYGNGYYWPTICEANRDQISNCDLIYPGQRLKVPAKHASLQAEVSDRYVPKHSNGYVAKHTSGAISGTLSCSGLELLWDSAGGNPSDAYTAAEIAMAESGGQQFAVSPTDDYGYWQINRPSWGSLATFDPMGNAEAAIRISNDGTNWGPWTTYRTGAYIGQCR